MLNRCAWSDNDAMRDYHDKVWGIPLHDDRMLFEFLTLEGAQAGLSWATILARRDSYRQAFDNYEIAKIAAYDQTKVDELLANPGIIRNKLKVNSVIGNAKGVLAIQNSWQTLKDAPVKTDISEKMSKALGKRGFKFVGAGICYSFMQAVGMVNDHTLDCFRHDEVRALS